MLEQIVPLILTYDEAPNLDRTLQKLKWATEIIVIDSYSEDATLDILQCYPQVKIFQRQFDTHANQWNFGLQQICAGWVLSLDADYVLTDALIAEMQSLSPMPNIDGYFINLQICVFGKPLRCSILPPRQALFRSDRAHYIDDGHTQLLQVKGRSGSLCAPIYHDDRKPLSRWLWAQDRYMIIETKKLTNTPIDQLSWSDRLRTQTLIAPFVMLLYCLILKGGIFDGWRGWYYAFQRMLAEILLAIRLIEARKVAQSVPYSPQQPT